MDLPSDGNPVQEISHKLDRIGIGHRPKRSRRCMDRESMRWGLGLIYIVAVAGIWIAASYIVQEVVDSGVSPFLITYLCNSLFVIYIPIVEIGRYFEDSFKPWSKKNSDEVLPRSANLEKVTLLEVKSSGYLGEESVSEVGSGVQDPERTIASSIVHDQISITEDNQNLIDEKGRWTRTRVAKVGFLICPFWFLAQLTFNLSLKYTTVSSNTILSTSSSLFTFLVALVFLGETFTWLKLGSVLLCMVGTIIVSLADSRSGANAIAKNPFLGDILALLSSALYAIYITLIRKKLPDESKGEGQASIAQFLGYLGLFNMLIFFPVALVLNFTKLEPFHRLGWKYVGLIVGKGLLDNVLSDYLWAKAIHLTTTTIATAGLTIQVPIAAIVDSLTGHAPKLMDYVGAAAVMVGFAGMNISSNGSSENKSPEEEQETTSNHVVDIHLECQPQ